MENFIGQDYADLGNREQFIRDNCTKCEVKSYMKPFTADELSQIKESLVTTTIEISKVEEERQNMKAQIKAKMLPLQEKLKSLTDKAKSKSELVNETCYKFVDYENKEIGYYNAEGRLIESRPANEQELNKNIFDAIREQKKTGTND